MNLKEAPDTNRVVPLGANVNGFEKELEELLLLEGRKKSSV